MSKPEPVVGILTTRVRPTLIDLTDRIDTYEVSKQRGTFKDGRPFCIFTHANNIRGMPLLDYEVWNGHNLSDREERDIAEMRIIARSRVINNDD